MERFDMKLERKKFTGYLLRSFAVLLLFSLGACTAAGEEIYFEPQEVVFSDIGSVESLNFYLDQTPSGLSGYNLTLSINDPSVARITGVEFPSWASLNSSSSLPAASVQIKAVDLTEKVNSGGSNVLLGTVTVESLALGESNLTVSVNRLDDDSENTISAIIHEAKLTSGSTSGIPIVSILPAEVTLSSGTTQVLEIRADKFPEGLSGYDLNLTLENTNIGKFTDLEFPSWAAISENSSLPANSVNLRAVDLNGIQSGDEDVLLASVTFLAENPGESEISLTFNRLDDDSGNEINALTEASDVKVQGSSTLPVASFTASPTSGYSPLAVQFTDESTGSPTAWAWDFDNDGSIDSTEQNPSHTYTSAGTYAVSLTVTNADGSNSELKTDYITVSESSTPIEPVAAFTADVTSGTAPLTVNFTDQSTGSPTSWAWDFGDGVDSAEQNPSHTYASAGNYTVNLTVTNAGGSDEEIKTDYIKVVKPSSGGQNNSSVVSLNVTIVPAICFEVSPSALKFGELSSGQTSEPQFLTLKNCGGTSINVIAEVSDYSAGDELFSLGLLLDSQIWSDYWNVIGSNSQENTTVALHVPSDYTGTGNKKGTITFWAEVAE